MNEKKKTKTQTSPRCTYTLDCKLHRGKDFDYFCSPVNSLEWHTGQNTSKI